MREYLRAARSTYDAFGMSALYCGPWSTWMPCDPPGPRRQDLALMLLERKFVRLSRSAKTRPRREASESSGGRALSEGGRRGARSTIKRFRQQTHTRRGKLHGDEATNDIYAPAGRDSSLQTAWMLHST